MLVGTPRFNTTLEALSESQPPSDGPVIEPAPAELRIPMSLGPSCEAAAQCTDPRHSQQVSQWGNDSRHWDGAVHVLDGQVVSQARYVARTHALSSNAH